MSRERRQYPRITHPIAVRYRAHGNLDSLWHEATTINVSAVGMRMRGAELLERARLLELTMEVPGLREPLLLKGRVVWAQLQASQVIESGVEFDTLAVEQETKLDQLLRFFHR